MTETAPTSSDTDAALPPLDLRAARVLSADDHPNADRLMLLRIDLGGEERQVVAGIVGHYEPDELEGKTIVIVANLVPAKLRGEISEGMLLACENEEGDLGLLTAPDSGPGTPILEAGPLGEAPAITFAEFQEHELVADEQGVSVDGMPVEAVRLVVDRGVRGRLR